MWDPGYTGDKSGYNGSHKFQSVVNAFKLTINSGLNVDAYDRAGGVSSLTSSNNYWAITLDSNANSPIRGLSAQGLSASGGTVTGTLVSDGIFHWYGNYPDTNMTTAEGYNPNFDFVFTGTDNGGGSYTGTMTLYATTPIPGTVLLLGSGLLGLAGLGWRVRKS